MTQSAPDSPLPDSRVSLFSLTITTPQGGAGIFGAIAGATAHRDRRFPDGPTPAPTREHSWAAVEQDRAALLGVRLPPEPGQTLHEVKFQQ